LNGFIRSVAPQANLIVKLSIPLNGFGDRGEGRGVMGRVRSFNSIERIRGRGVVDLSEEFEDSFNSIERIHGDGDEVVIVRTRYRLSIPLNGFLRFLCTPLRTGRITFNSIERIPSTCSSTGSSTPSTRLSIPLNGFRLKTLWFRRQPPHPPFNSIERIREVAEVNTLCCICGKLSIPLNGFRLKGLEKKAERDNNDFQFH